MIKKNLFTSAQATIPYLISLERKKLIFVTLSIVVSKLIVSGFFVSLSNNAVTKLSLSALNVSLS